MSCSQLFNHMYRYLYLKHIYIYIYREREIHSKTIKSKLQTTIPRYLGRNSISECLEQPLNSAFGFLLTRRQVLVQSSRVSPCGIGAVQSIWIQSMTSKGAGLEQITEIIQSMIQGTIGSE